MTRRPIAYGVIRAGFTTTLAITPNGTYAHITPRTPTAWDPDGEPAPAPREDEQLPTAA
jgi:hypothetical protein